MVAWQLREIDNNTSILESAASSGVYTKSTILGAYLAIPLDFFHDEGCPKAPLLWGYVGKVVRSARADKPAFWVKFHDGEKQFYLNPHPAFLDNEKHRYLNSPEVKIIAFSGDAPRGSLPT